MNKLLYPLLLSLLLLSCRANQERKYTVELIDKDGDTTYIMNRRPFTWDQAIDMGKGFPGKARAVLWDSVWKR